MKHSAQEIVPTLCQKVNDVPFGLELLDQGAALMAEEEIVLILEILDTKFHTAAFQILKECDLLTDRIEKVLQAKPATIH